MKKKLIMLSAIVVVLLLVPMTLSAIADQDDTPETYDNLYAAVQGETNAAAAYRAFAAQAET
ncbi:MAG: hypothetical protein FWH50_03800, partial [Coriobacteriia bacterium]|nr:hypothetical protein [Coriobacteriia bacterium]